MRLSSAYTVVLVTSLFCGLGIGDVLSIESASLVHGVDGVLSGYIGNSSSQYVATASSTTDPTGTSTGGVTTESLTTTGKAATSTTITQTSQGKTTSGVTSGTLTPSTTHATSTTTASASPSAKKNVASQCRGFVGGAGILLLIGMLAGL